MGRDGRSGVIPALLWALEVLSPRHTLLVLAMAGTDQLERYSLGGALVISLGSSPNAPPGLGRALRLERARKALTAFRPDVIHGFWLGESGLTAGLLGKWLGAPVVISLGGGELTWLSEIGYGGQGRRWTRWQASLALRLATRRGDQALVTAGSQFALAQLQRQGVAAQWAPLGVKAELFTGSAARPPGPPWRLLQVASLNRVKAPEVLLRAMRRIVDCQPQARLDWLGEDTLGGAVQQLAQRLNLDQQVFFHGFKPVDELVPFYRQAHLYLQSSYHESQGVAVLEAAAAGTPSVGTAVGLVAELAPEMAMATAVGDDQALARAALDLLADPRRREALGQQAQRWAWQHDAAWTAAQFERLYTQAAGERASY
jgi:glycosyltransferase involved in cell wall biosynthesis